MAVLVLGLGIGVNDMLFTILNAHTIRGLPIPHAEQVVFVSTIDQRQLKRSVSYPDFEACAIRFERWRAWLRSRLSQP